MKRVIILFGTILISVGAIANPAFALLREHHQSPGVLRYHAQHSIKDKQQRAWQVILFPEDMPSGETRYYLRLVGFPGLVEFVHPQSLEIITSQGAILSAPDVFAINSPAANVGQYDVTEILPNLSPEVSLKIIFSSLINNSEDISLKINPSIITEWQLLQRNQT